MAGVSKQLTCRRCEQVMAAAVFRVFGGLRITTPDGVLLPPVTGHLLLTIAEQRLKSASAEDYPEAKRRLARSGMVIEWPSIVRPSEAPARVPSRMTSGPLGFALLLKIVCVPPSTTVPEVVSVGSCDPG